MRFLRMTMYVLCLFSTSASAFSTDVTAMVLNAAMNNLDVLKMNQLRYRTERLYQTLDSEEVSVLMMHDGLRVGTYMYVVDSWQDKSLRYLLTMRGLDLSNKKLTELGIDLKMLDAPLSAFGSLNLSANPECQQSSTSMTTYNYIDLLNTVEQLIRLTETDDYTHAAEAALFYIKYYYYIRLHMPVASHTYTNEACQSDLNGLLTCMTEQPQLAPLRPYLEKTLADYRKLNLNDWQYDTQLQERIEQCATPAYYWFYSAGGLSPTGDKKVIAGSEILLSTITPQMMKDRKQVQVNDIFAENRRLIDMFYQPEQFKKWVGKTQTTNYTRLTQDVFLYRLKQAALRTRYLLDIEPIIEKDTAIRNE